jgi:hypothetical protein
VSGLVTALAIANPVTLSINVISVIVLPFNSVDRFVCICQLLGGGGVLFPLLKLYDNTIAIAITIKNKPENSRPLLKIIFSINYLLKFNVKKINKIHFFIFINLV